MADDASDAGPEAAMWQLLYTNKLTDTTALPHSTDYLQHRYDIDRYIIYSVYWTCDGSGIERAHLLHFMGGAIGSVKLQQCLSPVAQIFFRSELLEVLTRGQSNLAKATLNALHVPECPATAIAEIRGCPKNQK